MITNNVLDYNLSIKHIKFFLVVVIYFDQKLKPLFRKSQCVNKCITKRNKIIIKMSLVQFQY